jgi:hypothetical protein
MQEVARLKAEKTHWRNYEARLQTKLAEGKQPPRKEKHIWGSLPAKVCSNMYYMVDALCLYTISHVQCVHTLFIIMT